MVVTVLLTAGLAYYVYVPLPDDIQEPWKLMVVDAGFRTAMKVVRREEWKEVASFVRCDRTPASLTVSIDL